MTAQSVTDLENVETFIVDHLPVIPQQLHDDLEVFARVHVLGHDIVVCPIKQDLSNYWTPALYYQAEDGTFESVPQSGDGGGTLGGMNVYYL